VPPDPAIDQEALAALRQGDDSALKGFIARWQGPLMRFAFRHVQNEADANDLVAEAFVRFYQHRHRLDPDSKPGAWLYTTLANLCHNHNRWKRRHPTRSIEGDGQPADGRPPAAALAASGPDPAAALQRDETVGAVREAVARLPQDLRTALLLHHYEHLSYQEIADIAGCSERGVETRLYRARQRLRRWLEPLWESAGSEADGERGER
jgi:RNA polymerase sigma-70 factor (ECF subfamily)